MPYWQLVNSREIMILILLPAQWSYRTGVVCTTTAREKVRGWSRRYRRLSYLQAAWYDGPSRPHSKFLNTLPSSHSSPFLFVYVRIASDVFPDRLFATICAPFEVNLAQPRRPGRHELTSRIDARNENNRNLLLFKSKARR